MTMTRGAFVSHCNINLQQSQGQKKKGMGCKLFNWFLHSETMSYRAVNFPYLRAHGHFVTDSEVGMGSSHSINALS
jgi:hypothetical protein